MDLFTQHNYLVIVLHLLIRCRHHVFVVSRIDYMYYLSFDFLIICHYSPHFNLTFSIIASFSCSSPIWFIVDFTTDTYTFFRMVDLRFYTLDLPFKVTMTIFLYAYDDVHVAEKSLFFLAVLIWHFNDSFYMY